jgi:hypothetical protein
VSEYAKDYVDVAARIAEFYTRYPEGSLQMDPVEWVEIEGARFVMGRAYAYRTPDDQRPGIGTAWEPVPGRTPYTRGSEVQNLETSAWGRAIAALGVATKAGIATAQDVESSKARQVEYVETSARSGPLARAQAREATGPASEKQVGYLRKIMREQSVTEYQLAEFARDKLGFDTPPEGLDSLTKQQASSLIDALTKQVQS